MYKSKFVIQLHKKLEQVFLSTVNVDKYLKQFSTSLNEEQIILWMEVRLLEAKGPWFHTFGRTFRFKEVKTCV